jgi:recombination protein RecT
MAETKRSELSTRWEKDLLKYEPAIRALLRESGQQGGFEKYFQLVLRQVKEKLIECTPSSVIVSILDCASLGLSPDPALGHAYFVPYKNKKGILECKFMPGYKGYISLMMRNGVETVDARIVYSNDLFEVSLGTDAYIKHIPNPKLNESRGEIIGAYAIMKLKGVERPKFEVMSLGEIKKAQAESKYGTADDSPWVKWFESMCKKTVIKNLARYAELSPDINKLVTVDEANEYEIKINRSFAAPVIESNSSGFDSHPAIIELHRGLENIPVGMESVTEEEVLKTFREIQVQWLKAKHPENSVKEYGIKVLNEFQLTVKEAYAKV